MIKDRKGDKLTPRQFAKSYICEGLNPDATHLWHHNVDYEILIEMTGRETEEISRQVKKITDKIIKGLR